MLGADRLGLSFISCLVPIISWNPTFLFHGGNFNASTVGIIKKSRHNSSKRSRQSRTLTKELFPGAIFMSHQVDAHPEIMGLFAEPHILLYWVPSWTKVSFPYRN